MSKATKTAGLAYATVAPALVQQVEAVLASAKKHKYSASAVYAAHNQVFEKKETPEVCASCVTKRADALKKWYTGYAVYQNEQNNQAANEEGMAQTGDGKADLPKTLQSIYDSYAATIVGAETKTTDETEGETAGIIRIMEKHEGELTEEEVNLLTDRLGVLKAQDLVKQLDAPNVPRETVEAPAGGFTVTNKKGEAFGVTFESEDGVNGSLLLADGKAAKPGTYTTETGDSYAVQIGGKATYKNDAI